MGEQLTVEKLFNASWVKAGFSSVLLCIYFPVGLILLIIRGFILLQFFLLGYLLPPSKFRQKCLRVISAVLGLSVSTEGEIEGHVFVSNHITSYDHFAIHLATNAVLPRKTRPSLIIAKTLGIIELHFETLTKPQIESSEDQYIIFPEGETTSGEVGMLSFSSTEIPSGLTVQPVGIKVSRLLLNTSCAGATLFQEIVALLFSPNTHFILKFLPSQTVDPEGVWKQRIPSQISQSIKVSPTKFNAADKSEYIKRLFFRPPNLTTMAREVQRKIGPHIVSPELILSTLQTTGSVDATIEALKQSGALAAAPTSTFSKSATQRMMSFQERKMLMIAAARQKYIEKHNLVLPSS